MAACALRADSTLSPTLLIGITKFVRIQGKKGYQHIPEEISAQKINILPLYMFRLSLYTSTQNNNENNKNKFLPFCKSHLPSQSWSEIHLADHLAFK